MGFWNWVLGGLLAREVMDRRQLKKEAQTPPDVSFTVEEENEIGWNEWEHTEFNLIAPTEVSYRVDFPEEMLGEAHIVPMDELGSVYRGETYIAYERADDVGVTTATAERVLKSGEYALIYMIGQKDEFEGTVPATIEIEGRPPE